ncbi:hypothetical protein AA0229_2046 [Gluconobacter cerinus NRIC 0229]|uniref:Uncharacterized protein n=1 Tax=Gluconobacter cerinus TaxID=38307 RepID=A0AAV5NDP1_9PROT|nr:hypothetical protein AA0229_2046 [Gluconobacter cerinus NRIC 0229]GLQ62115.1 hypothetical protein GCM10007867_09600 [Gluconobacter cerinus]
MARAKGLDILQTWRFLPDTQPDFRRAFINGKTANSLRILTLKLGKKVAVSTRDNNPLPIMVTENQSSSSTTQTDCQSQ